MTVSPVPVLPVEPPPPDSHGPDTKSSRSPDEFADALARANGRNDDDEARTQRPKRRVADNAPKNDASASANPSADNPNVNAATPSSAPSDPTLVALVAAIMDITASVGPTTETSAPATPGNAASGGKTATTPTIPSPAPAPAPATADSTAPIAQSVPHDAAPAPTPAPAAEASVHAPQPAHAPDPAPQVVAPPDARSAPPAIPATRPAPLAPVAPVAPQSQATAPTTFEAPASLAATTTVADASAVSATTATAPAPPPPPADQLFTVMRPLHRAPDGSYHLRIEMRPPELGRVEMRVEMRDGVLHASIHAEHASTAQLVRDALDDLRARLTGEGVQAGDLTVADGRTQERDPDTEHATAKADDTDKATVTTTGAASPSTASPDTLLDIRI